MAKNWRAKKFNEVVREMYAQAGLTWPWRSDPSEVYCMTFKLALPQFVRCSADSIILWNCRRAKWDTETFATMQAASWVGDAIRAEGAPSVVH